MHVFQWKCNRMLFRIIFSLTYFLCSVTIVIVWLNGSVVSALGIQARGPRFESRFVPLFHWVATLGKLFTHIAFPVSQLQETGVQKGSFRRLNGYGD